jgi:Zn finger protein HypA/HybF involved in hydrogenase expression
MREENTLECRECGEELFELDSEFYCPSCDSVSGFELVPDRESFEL